MFFFVLITCLLDIALIAQGEILSWSLRGLKGLTTHHYLDFPSQGSTSYNILLPSQDCSLKCLAKTSLFKLFLVNAKIFLQFWLQFQNHAISHCYFLSTDSSCCCCFDESQSSLHAGALKQPQPVTNCKSLSHFCFALFFFFPSSDTQ